MLWEEGLRLLNVKEDPWQCTMFLSHLAMVALDKGDYERASTQLGESLTLLQELGERSKSVLAVETSARLAAEQGSQLETGQGDSVRAARLFGAAEALRESLAVPILAEDRLSYERGLATLRAHFDSGALLVAWAEGVQ